MTGNLCVVIFVENSYFWEKLTEMKLTLCGGRVARQEGGGDWGACIEVRGGALNLAYSTVRVGQGSVGQGGVGSDRAGSGGAGGGRVGEGGEGDARDSLTTRG